MGARVVGEREGGASAGYKMVEEVEFEETTIRRLGNVEDVDMVLVLVLVSGRCSVANTITDELLCCCLIRTGIV